MKYFVLTILCFASLFSSSLKAQDFDCDSFCVKYIYIDTLGQMVVAIHFAGDETDFINYPHIAAVLNEAGDTLAAGQLHFFGQVGGTTVEHPAATVLTDIPEGFTAIVHFRFDDTLCVLSYPCLTTATNETGKSAGFTIYPNPAGSVANLLLEATSGTVSVYSLHGILMKKMNFIQDAEIELQVGDLAGGMYLIVVQTRDFTRTSLFLKADSE